MDGFIAGKRALFSYSPNYVTLGRVFGKVLAFRRAQKNCHLLDYMLIRWMEGWGITLNACAC